MGEKRRARGLWVENPAWGAVLDLSKIKETLAVGGVWAWLTSGTVLRLSAQRALALLE